MNETLRQIIKKTFAYMGVKIQQYDRNFPELWSNSPEFQALYKEIKPYTVVWQTRCFMLYQLARYAGAKEGEMAQVGVYKGGTAKLIAKTCPHKTIHLFDTFSGTPKEDPSIDSCKKGGFSDTSFESVREYFTDCDNVLIHPGFFPATAETIKDKLFCLADIDVSLYRSVKDCLEFFYDRMVSGGIMSVAGYEWTSCPGAKKAIHEFLADKAEFPIITTQYQCMFIKI